MILYLCGFMGCGKTRSGRRLAEKLQTRFADLDYIITVGEGCGIPEIFDKIGESGFRRIETAYLEDFARRYTEDVQGGVVNDGNGGNVSKVGVITAVAALGGGTVLAPENVRVIKKSGLLFFIDTSFEVCYNRIYRDSNRPVAANSTKAELRERYLARRGIYTAAANYRVNGDGDLKNGNNANNDDYVVREIFELLGVVRGQ